MSREFHLFLPQMRMGIETIVERARAAERSGFDGIALMDHLVAPGAEHHGTYDAVTCATWLAAHTSTLGVGHLVLCDGFRHPAVLAKQAVTIDHASGGRFELGLGWGSFPSEIERFGTGPLPASERFGRLAESVEVISALWTGEAVTFAGEYHQLRNAVQQPVPTRPIPVVIGGAGPRTMRLVAEHATWWNCPNYAFDRFDELKQQAGAARASLQVMIAVVPDEASRAEVEAVTARRFGADRADILLGTPSELVDALGDLGERGVERFYLWLTDFAQPESLAALGSDVLPHLR